MGRAYLSNDRTAVTAKLTALRLVLVLLVEDDCYAKLPHKQTRQRSRCGRGEVSETWYAHTCRAAQESGLPMP